MTDASLLCMHFYVTPHRIPLSIPCSPVTIGIAEVLRRRILPHQRREVLPVLCRVLHKHVEVPLVGAQILPQSGTGTSVRHLSFKHAGLDHAALTP